MQVLQNKEAYKTEWIENNWILSVFDVKEFGIPNLDWIRQAFGKGRNFKAWIFFISLQKNTQQIISSVYLCD